MKSNETTSLTNLKIDKINTFSESTLHPNILKNIKYKIPMPVQQHVIPLILAGRDLIVSAQTGSGKTAAFLLPLLDFVYREINNSFSKHLKFKLNPLVLILTPTRELAIQIYDETIKFSQNSHLENMNSLLSHFLFSQEDI